MDTIFYAYHRNEITWDEIVPMIQENHSDMSMSEIEKAFLDWIYNSERYTAQIR